MFLSFFAGFFIGLGAIAYLMIGGALGAFCFSIGLISVLTFGFHLFTGKAGLLSIKKIKVLDLAEIWCGNLAGCGAAYTLVFFTPAFMQLQGKAAAIMATRAANGFIANVVLGILCGILMSVAVFGFQKTGNYLFAVAPVAIFILCGFNHCVADMFYLICSHIEDDRAYFSLIPTTIGNIIGCNISYYLSSSS